MQSPPPSALAPQHPAPPYPYAPGYPPPAPRTNALSVASLVLGIVWLGGLGSLLAVIFGHIGLGQVKRSRGTQTGTGLALAGTILGYVGCIAAIAIAALVISAAAPEYSAQQALGQDSEAKSNVRNLVSQIEACAADYAGEYTKCSSQDLGDTGLALGAGKGQVQTTAVGYDTYTVDGLSESGTHFTLTKAADGVSSRTCDRLDEGGCSLDGTW
jgi:Domain of unknown function (DUF4190)